MTPLTDVATANYFTLHMHNARVVQVVEPIEFATWPQILPTNTKIIQTRYDRLLCHIRLQLSVQISLSLEFHEG